MVGCHENVPCAGKNSRIVICKKGTNGNRRGQLQKFFKINFNLLLDRALVDLH